METDKTIVNIFKSGECNLKKMMLISGFINSYTLQK